MERGRTGSTGKRLPKLPGLRQMIFGRKEGKTDQSDWNRLGKGRMKSEGKNKYKLPHMNKKRLSKLGKLPMSVVCSEEAIQVALEKMG